MSKCLYGFAILDSPNRGTSTISSDHYMFSFESEQDRDNVVGLTLVFSHGDHLGIPLVVHQHDPIDAVEDVGPAKKLSVRRYRGVAPERRMHNGETR